MKGIVLKLSDLLILLQQTVQYFSYSTNLHCTYLISPLPLSPAHVSPTEDTAHRWEEVMEMPTLE